MKENKFYHKTTVVMQKELHDSLKIMCVLTNSTISNFIKISVQDKIKQLKENGVALKNE